MDVGRHVQDNYFAQPAQVENQWFRNAMTPGFSPMAESGTYPINTDADFEGNLSWDMRHVPIGPTGSARCWAPPMPGRSPVRPSIRMHLGGAQVPGRPYLPEKAVVRQEGMIPVLKSLQELYRQGGEIRPSLKKCAWRPSPRLEWGYPEDTFWFKNQNAAAEIISAGAGEGLHSGRRGTRILHRDC